MGIWMSRLASGLISKQDIRIMMLGLDNAGKTTLLYKLKLGKTVTTFPTFSFNVETVQRYNRFLTIWDVGGVDRIWALRRHYYQGSQGFIFVVDSSDLDRVMEAREALHALLGPDDLRDPLLPVLVFANKQDLPRAMDTTELTDKLGLQDLQQYTWYIQPTCAIDGKGLDEGLEWLVNNLKPEQRAL